MQISPIRCNNYCFSNTAKKKNNVSFGSFCADANGSNQNAYAMYTLSNPDYSIMKSSSTRIFRDLPSELAIAKMLNPNQKTQIKILGCSDGSEAWGYAIAIKEAMGEKAKNVSIQAVDMAPHMIESANTGCLVLSDIERKYAAGEQAVYKEKSPIAKEGWNKYLTKTKRPEEFEEILKKYPYMKYLEYDPVVYKSIGKGLNWYEVNKEGLPEVTFECDNMFNCLEPNEEAQNVVYVMANSAAYIFEKNPKDFVRLFQEISENSKDKNTYIAIGDIESKILNSDGCIPYPIQLALKQFIGSLGFKNISENELSKLGIISTSGTSKKLYKHQDNE